MSDPFADLVKRITTVYAPPSHIDPKNAGQMAEVLATYRRASARHLPTTAAAADLALENLTSSHQYWSWPTPGEVAEAFQAIKSATFKNRIGE